MYPEQLISIHLEAYRTLCTSLGKENDEAVRLYSKLREMVIVEIYFMKSLRYLLKDEEIGDFVIYVNDDIQGIIDNFEGSRGFFMNYLKESMERRAMSFLGQRMQQVNMRRAFMEFKGTGTLYIDQKTPEDMLCVSETASEQREKRNTKISMLRYLCAQNPIRRKKLYTFFCTLSPFLSLNVIERFCEAINCDKRQTMAITRKLCSIQRKEDQHRYSRSYQTRKVDYHWSKILEYEGHAMIATNPDKLKDKADYHRALLRNSLEGMIRSKMNVNYSVVAGILNLDPTTVASYVMQSKHLLEKVLSTSPPRSMHRFMRKGNGALSRFMPYEVFGIKK